MPERQLLIEEAWRRMPQASAIPGPGHFTRARFERISEVFVALGGAVLGAQSLIVAFGDHQFQTHSLALIATIAALVTMIVACVIGRFARTAAGTFAVVFVVVLVLWIVIDTESFDRDSQPWPFFLLSICTGAAVIAFPLPWQIPWAIVPPVLFGVAQLVRSGFEAAAWEALGFDSSIAILLNVLIVVLGWMFRGIADGVDQARARVVEAYTKARATEAAERERVEVASLMHDSVLAALIAAARADSPRAQRLAADMSREALTRLADAETDGPEGSDAATDVAEIARAIERAAAEIGVALAAAVEVPDEAQPVPGRVARALVLAAKQAVANAVHHADARGLAVAVGVAGAAVRVTIADSGPGLDLEAIPADRLGIRASILARLAAVGGSAEVESGAHGTTVSLAWSAAPSGGADRSGDAEGDAQEAQS